MTATGCGERHWFAYPGMVGSSAPRCTRCHKARNPRYRPEDDPNRRETPSKPGQ